MTVHRVGSSLAALAVFACAVTVASAQTPPPAAKAKGAAVLGSVKVTATVQAIDYQTRVVTVKGEGGQEYTFTAGPAVRNLAQVKVGDVVSATYTEALAYEVKKGGTAGASSVSAAGRAAPGARPAGAVVGQTTVTVAITAIDPSVPSVTFKGPQGNTRTIKVKDATKLQGVSVGDTVDLTYTEALAIKVEKAPAAVKK